MPKTNVNLYVDYSKAPDILKEFIFYSETIKGLSARTVRGNYIDLQLFFRFIMQKRTTNSKKLYVVEKGTPSLVGTPSFKFHIISETKILYLG